MSGHDIILCGREHYRPLKRELKEFRLIIIRPGTCPEMIECYLRIASLDHEILPTYETISYCWGDASQKKAVLLNGSLIAVPTSAMEALMHVRLPDKERVVWLDYVCIDQHNIQERETQVALMGLIYRSAKANLICLGDLLTGDEPVEGILQALLDGSKSIREATVLLNEADQYFFNTHAMHPEIWRNEMLIARQDILAVIRRFFCKPWFSRLWVLQEASLARKNICFWGECQFNFADAFHYAAYLYGESTKIVDSVGLVDLDDGKQLLDGVANAYTLLQQVAKSRTLLKPDSFLSGQDIFEDPTSATVHLSCQDQRDHVFAFLELFRLQSGAGKIPPQLIPNYTKPVEEVFQCTTHWLLQNSLRHLLPVNHRTNPSSEMPLPCSWIIQFDRTHDPLRDPHRLDMGHRAGIRRGASLTGTGLIDQPMPSGTLHLKGSVLNLEKAHFVQAHTSKELPSFDELCDTFRGIARLLGGTVDPSFATLFHAAPWLSDVLTAGSLYMPDSSASDKMIKQKTTGFRNLLTKILSKKTLPPSNDANLPASLENARAFLEYYAIRTRHRCFFSLKLLDNALVGLGPNTMLAGDVVAVCEGAPHPFVLRPQGHFFRFVGAAYIHQLTNGEIFDMGLPWASLNVR